MLLCDARLNAQGIDGAAVNGALTTVVNNGFPPGSYRACSMCVVSTYVNAS